VRASVFREPEQSNGGGPGIGPRLIGDRLAGPAVEGDRGLRWDNNTGFTSIPTCPLARSRMSSGLRRRDRRGDRQVGKCLAAAIDLSLGTEYGSTSTMPD